MSEFNGDEIDAQIVIGSLQNQIAEQALRIAVLEARIVAERAANNGKLDSSGVP